MADDVIDGAPEGAAEVTDLRSTIRAAVDAQRAPEPEVAEVAESPEPETVEKPAKIDAADKGDKGETEAERNARLRDDKGRFAKGDEKPAEVAKVEPEPAKEAAPGDDKPAIRPPPGWSPTAKVAFDKADPAIKEAVAKREEEVNRGFAKLTEYKPVERFMEMAKQSGTTLDRALENYVGMENRLRQDFPAGILELCQRQGIHPVALANQILARNGVAPSEGQAGETPANQTVQRVDPAVLQKLNALEQRLAQQDQIGVQTEIQRFASDPKHTFFENVKADMGCLIDSGYAENLDDAYEKACWANPEIRNLLIKQQSPAVPSANAAEAVQRAKAAAKATGGAPSAGFKPNAGTEGLPLRDTIRAAVNAQRGI